MNKRNLTLIINEIIKLEPRLEPEFKSLLASISCTAPEIMYLRWNRCASILNGFYLDNKPNQKVEDLFNGRNTDSNIK